MANRACKVITTSSSPVNIGVSTAAAGAPTKARSAMAKGLGEERLTSAMNTGFPRATLVWSAIRCALAIRSAAAAALASIFRALVSSMEKLTPWKRIKSPATAVTPSEKGSSQQA